MLEYKRLRAAAFKAAPEGADGVIEAIVAVFGNVDEGEDRIAYGAFAASLAARTPKGVWMHDWDKPVARTLEARELPPGDPLLPPDIAALGGLYIRGEFNLDTQRGREAFSDIKFGIVDEFSIGYRSVRSQYDEETDVRDLLEVELYEWSPVLVGMNPATALLSAKGAPVSGMSVDEHKDAVVAAVSGFGARMRANLEARASEKRRLSAANGTRLDEVLAALDGLRDELKELRGQAHDGGGSADSAFARFLELTSGAHAPARTEGALS